MTEFSLDDHEYIELNKLLKLMRLVNSGGEANFHIDSGEVLVNNLVETQKRKKLRTGDVISFNDKQITIK